MRLSIQSIRIISVLFLFSFSALYGQDEREMAVPAPKGIVIFAGMDLANGNKVESYSIERSYDKRQWEKLAELKSPAGWESFQAAIDKWKPDFGFQGLPGTDDARQRWQKCETANVIDSMGYWASSTTVRLAAGIAYYDQTAEKDKKVWYKVRAYQSGKTVSEYISLPVQHPFVPHYDPIVLNDKNVDKTLFYLKWQSEGSEPAPYFGIRYYEDKQLHRASGSLASYRIDNTTYYIFQDSTARLKSDRQYFLNPWDVYGNPGGATDIVLVSASSVDQSFFQQTGATSDPKGFGVILSWRIKNTLLLKGLKIYKSDSFDGKEYTLAATIPPTDTTYIDRDIAPDKINYYYLETISSQDDEPVRSNVFFNAAYDVLKPVPPFIEQGKQIDKGVEIQVTASDMYLSGLKIYRNDSYTAKLYPITDLLKPDKDNTVIYTDTSKTLAGDKSYLYAAKAVSTSSVESDFSDTLTIHPNIKIYPPSPNRISAYEEDRRVGIIWEDVRTRHRATRGYYVYRRELPDGEFIPLLPKDSIAPDPMFTDSTVQPDKTYEYAVQTVDDLGGTSESMALYFIHVKRIVLPVPPNVWLTQSEGEVTVQWNEISITQPLKVNLYRYQRGEKPELLKSFLLNEQQFTDAEVEEGKLYFYFTTFTDENNQESFRSKEAGIRLE